MDVYASNWMSEVIRNENRARDLWERRRVTAPAAPRGPQQLSVSLPPVAIVGSQHVYRDRIDVASMPEAGHRNYASRGVPIAWGAEPPAVTPKPGAYAERQQRWNPVVEQGYIINNAAGAPPVAQFVQQQQYQQQQQQPPQYQPDGAAPAGYYYDQYGNAAAYAPGTAAPYAQAPAQYYPDAPDAASAGFVPAYVPGGAGYVGYASEPYGPSTRVTRQVTRQVEVPYQTVAHVPVVDRQIVTRMVPHTVTSNQLVRVPGVQEVEEQYVEYAPVTRTRTVQRPCERVVERPVAHTVLVPQDTVEERRGVALQPRVDRRVVEVTEQQEYDVVEVPVGMPHAVAQRELYAAAGNPSNLSSQVAYHMYQPGPYTTTYAGAYADAAVAAAPAPYCAHAVSHDAVTGQPTAACAGAARHSMIGLVLRATAPGRVRVVGVKPNSPAARAGICADDAVVAVGGVSVHDLATVSSVIHNHCAQYPVTRACRPLAFTLRRNGRLVHAAVVWW